MQIPWVACDRRSHCEEDRSFKSFHLSISLGVVSGDVYIVHNQRFTHTLEKLRGKLFAVVCDEIYGWSVLEYPIMDQVCRYLC